MLDFLNIVLYEIRSLFVSWKLYMLVDANPQFQIMNDWLNRENLVSESCRNRAWGLV
jgi:hypothetical protein